MALRRLRHAATTSCGDQRALVDFVRCSLIQPADALMDEKILWAVVGDESPVGDHEVSEDADG